MTSAAHTRVAFQFDGELDDVPIDAATALAEVVRSLLQHGDEHDGAPATMRVARLGPLLNLWLTDPQCSPACLGGSGHVPSTADRHDESPDDVRLALAPGPHGGLRLHWALVLPGVQGWPPRPRRIDEITTAHLTRTHRSNRENEE